MAITQSPLTSGNADGAITSQDTASITPGANKLILLATVNMQGASPVTPSVSGNGLTWVEIDSAHHDTGGQNAKIFLFRAMGTPSAGVVTLAYAAAQDGLIWIIDEYDGIDTSGTNGSGAIVQNANNLGSTQDIAVTLASFADANNAAYIAAAYDNDDRLMTQGTGLTKLVEETQLPENDELATAWRVGEDLTPSYAIDGATNRNMGAVAIEIKIAGAAAAGWGGLLSESRNRLVNVS